QCARLIKGYGETLKRGVANYRLIEIRVINPILADHIPLARGVDAVASARAAALADPDGAALARCLAEIEQAPALGVAAEGSRLDAGSRAKPRSPRARPARGL